MDHATLPASSELALNYSPRALRPLYATFFELDALCARALAVAAEPMFAQIRLAWWREQLSRSDKAGVERTPLLAEAHLAWGSPATELVALVDGWEVLVTDSLDIEVVDAFCLGRQAVAVAIAERAGQCDAGEAAGMAARRWSLAELLLRATDEAGSACVRREADRVPPITRRLPRSLGPLAVLDALGRRALAQGGGPLFQGRASIATALRAGFLGR